MRITGVITLCALPVVIWFPQKIPLVWFVLVSLPACGPWSPVVPVAFEPLILEIAKHETPLWVTAAALGITLYMEYLNWHIYGWVVERRRLTALRDHRLVRLGTKYFARAPFATTAILASVPWPFWTLRVLALLHKYPLRRFLLAMAIGRTPRLFALAWIGAQLRLSSALLLGMVGLAAVAGILWARSRVATASTAV